MLSTSFRLYDYVPTFLVAIILLSLLLLLFYYKQYKK